MEGRIDFQLLLDQFQGELIFLKLLVKTEASPDEHLYRIRTNNGDYCIFETDDCGNLDLASARIKGLIGNFKHLIKVKNPPESIVDATRFCVPTVYAPARNFDELEQYPGYVYTSSIYSCFLVRMYTQDVVVERRDTHNKE